MATTAHACGELRHHPGDAVLAAVEFHAQGNCSEYTCADWSAVLQTFTRLHARPHRLYSVLLQEVRHFLALSVEFTSSHVCFSKDRQVLLLKDCALVRCWSQAYAVSLATYTVNVAVRDPDSMWMLCNETLVYPDDTAASYL